MEVLTLPIWKTLDMPGGLGDLSNWLDVLTADNRAIVTAASPAQRAADFINGLQPAASARYLPTVASGRCIRPIDIL